MDILNDQANRGNYMCRLCKSTNVKMVKRSNVKNVLESKDFKITDAGYGQMLSIFKCGDCGFMQCLDAPDPTGYYRALEDTDYEIGRKDRIYQARKILNKLIKAIGRKPDGLRLLDVGAGSGILLEAATEFGFDAEGVEPSDWLRKTAHTHGCRINADVIPHPAISGPYDIVTLIDVVEHVSAPFEMIQNAAALLKPGGIIAIVTPDVRSMAARLMGWRWWHYRIAHVGYFSKMNLRLIFSNLGLITVSISRPSWSFSVAYIRDRLLQYLPGWLVLSNRQWMHNTRINLNLLDSLMFIGRRP